MQQVDGSFRAALLTGSSGPEAFYALAEIGPSEQTLNSTLRIRSQLCQLQRQVTQKLARPLLEVRGQFGTSHGILSSGISLWRMAFHIPAAAPPSGTESLSSWSVIAPVFPLTPLVAVLLTHFKYTLCGAKENVHNPM